MERRRESVCEYVCVVCLWRLLHTRIASYSHNGRRLTADGRIVAERHNYLNTSWCGS